MKSPLIVIDGHAHLDELENIEKDLQDAGQVGVSAVVGVGMDLESNQKILSIADNYPGCAFPAIGYHPWKIKRDEIEKNLLFIEENIEKCVAIGEVGLDYKARVKKALQKDVFKEIINLSVKKDKILILHCRYSHQTVFKMISEGGVKRAVFHWYTGSIDLLGEIISAGYYISATPALMYSPPHQNAVRKAPLHRILLETDCPVTYQGLESRPKDVLITLQEVAKIKGVHTEETAHKTTKNIEELFGLKGLYPEELQGKKC